MGLECGTIEQRPQRDNLTIYSLVEIICIVIMCVSTISGLWQYIKDFSLIPKIPGIIGFITDVCVIAGLVLIILGYLQNNDSYLKYSFICFLILVCLDLFNLICGMFNSKHFHIYISNGVRLFSEIYITICLYCQVIKGTSTAR